MTKSKEELEMLIKSTRSIIRSKGNSFATDYNDQSYVETVIIYCKKLLKYQKKWRKLDSLE
jgi:hypothetical protein